jgi:uncharacterized protein
MKNITKEKIYGIIPKEIIKEIFDDFDLDLEDGIHGIYHWARVIENGLEISQHNNANMNVIIAFGLFHDCQRENDSEDPDHGFRGGEFLEQFRGKLNLTNEEFDKAKKACAGHTNVLHDNDLDISTCWDADRLDLFRVGIYPEAEYLNNDIAKNDSFIESRSELAEYEENFHWMTCIIEDFHTLDVINFLDKKITKPINIRKNNI